MEKSEVKKRIVTRTQIFPKWTEKKKQLGLTSRDVANKLGISKSALSRREVGRQALTREDIIKICTELKINNDEMIDIFFEDLRVLSVKPPKETDTNNYLLDKYWENSVCRTCTHRYRGDKYLD
jgi:transcriptional regulator with XRE-family HTH domain